MKPAHPNSAMLTPAPQAGPRAAHDRAGAAATVAYRSKGVAAVLALLLGGVGVQNWYLRRRYAWIVTLFALVCAGLASREPVWFDTPAFFLFGVLVAAGMLEAAILALMSGERFDRRYNPQWPVRASVRLPHVLIALASVLLGAVVSMSLIAMVVMHVYERMGWLDGLVY